MLNVVYTNKFKKEYKIAIKRGCDQELLKEVVDLLRQEKTLPKKYRDHQLTGCYKGFRECHITPDWLLIYSVDSDNLVLTLTRTGSHSDLF